MYVRTNDSSPVAGGFLGEGRRIVMPPITIRVRPFMVLDRFTFARTSITERHLQMIERLADHVVRSQRTSEPVGTIRLVGHTDPAGRASFNLELGRQRAQAVASRLAEAIERRSPGLRIAIVVQTLGESRPVASNRTRDGRARNRRVEVFLMAAPAPTTTPVPPPPPPPPVRIPTPEEAARTLVPLRPETPEERLERILRTPLPAPTPRRTFRQWFWDRLDDRLNRTMRRLGVSRSVQGVIRRAARAAIERGASWILDEVLESTGLSSEAQEAIRAAVRAATQTPVR